MKIWIGVKEPLVQDIQVIDFVSKKSLLISNRFHVKQLVDDTRWLALCWWTSKQHKVVHIMNQNKSMHSFFLLNKDDFTTVQLELYSFIVLGDFLWAWQIWSPLGKDHVHEGTLTCMTGVWSLQQPQQSHQFLIKRKEKYLLN